MTGKSYAKTRIVVSTKLLSPLAHRKSFDEAAIAFRRSVNASVLSPRLNANISVKALTSAPSKSNTDGKKRTNKGGIPGVETFSGGYRYNPKQKWEPGKVLQIHSSYTSRMNQRVQTPNWGWVDASKKEIPRKNNAEIVIKKYSVNPKTGEKIEDSEVEISPFTATGKQPDWMIGTKQLPGKTIGQIMRGGSLLQAAARAVGVLTDSDGKLRCPPGTPAANQFTDAMGSNCFGFSASEIYDLAQRVAHESAHLMRELDFEDSSGLSSGAAPVKQRGALFNTIKSWRKLLGDVIEESREVPWMKPDGNQVIPAQWELDEMPDEFRWFKDGARRGRRSIRDMRERVQSLKDKYGISEPTGFDKNADLIELCDRLRADGIMTTEFLYRPETPEKWIQLAEATLYEKFGKRNLDKLSQDQKNDLLRKEIELQFELERAMLSEFIRSYSTMPDHMRTVGSIRWLPDADPSSDEGGAVWDVDAPNGKHSYIRLNMFRISANTQKYLPELLENERLRIEAENGGSESENAAALHDFLVSNLVYSKQSAALISGSESFARHIMAHEITHTVQLSALVGAINDELAATGRIRYYDKETGQWGYISGSSIKDLTNEEINSIITQIIKDPNGVKKIVPSLQKVIDDADKMRFLAGKYTDDIVNLGRTEIVQALEIMAELGALRAQGIIYGKDVDDALAWMDEHIDTRFSDERGISDAEETQKFIDLINYAQSVGPDRASQAFRDPLWTDERVYQASVAEEVRRISSMNNEDEIVDFIADREFEIEQLTEAVRNNPNDTEIGRQLKEAKDAMNLAKKRWRELNDGVDNVVLQEKVKRNRDEKDKLSPEILKKRNDVRDLEKIRDAADKASEDDVVNTLAYLKKKLEDKNLSEESKDKLRKYVAIYRKAFAKKKSDAGDPRSPQAISRELDKRINDRINPPKPKVEDTNPIDSSNPDVPKSKTKKPKPIKRPKNEAAVTRHANAEREKLNAEATDKEADALVEMSDPTGKAIADILDPEKRVEAIDRIRTRNDAMKTLGLDPDPMAYDEASLEEQLENILMPVLDILERSEISGPVEVETTVNLTPEQIDGSDNSPISVDSLITGRLIDGKGYSSGEPGSPDEKTGKIPHRVVIQTEDGQRGYYPNWSDFSDKKPSDYEQKVVLPPGKIEIVDRIKEKDGSTTLIARVVEQKNTEEILDSLVPGPDSDEIPAGAGIQIQRAVNKHIISRRERGLSQEQRTPQDEAEIIQDTNNISFDEIHEDGSSFGTQLDKENAEKINVDVDSPDSSDAEVYGPIETREERRKRRAEELSEITQRLQEIFSSGESDEELGISPEDIDPAVLAIIENSTPEELEQILAEEAENIHKDIDARPRDVVDEDGLEELIDPPVVDEEEKPSSFVWDSRRRPKGEGRPTGEEPSAPPADVNPETGEIIKPDEEDYKPTPKQSRDGLQKNFVWRSGYKDSRNRNWPTRIIEKILKNELSAYQAQNEIQRQLENTYPGSILYGIAMEGLGTAQLDEMTPEQIVWLMDHAFYKAAELRREATALGGNLTVSQRLTKQDLDNKAQAMGRMQSALQDYLDIIYYQVNGTFYYPNGEWNNWGNPFFNPSRPSIMSDRDGGFQRPGRDASQSDIPDLSPFPERYRTTSTDGDWDDDLTPEERRFLMDNPGKPLGGLSSGARSGIAGRVAKRLIRPAVDRLDVDEETKDRIVMVAEYAAAVASKGPTGALVHVATEAARRGGRDVAELTIKKLIDSGKITEEQAKIAMSVVDRVAPEGLPDPVKDALVDGYQVVDKFVDERVLTDENKERLLQATEEAREKLSTASEKTRDAVGDAAKKAKEKTRKGLAKLRDRKREVDDVPALDDVIYEAYSDPNDPFGSPPLPPARAARKATPSAFDEPYDFDPFAGLSSGASPTGNAGLSSGLGGGREKRRFSRRMRKAGKSITKSSGAASKGKTNNETTASTYIPLSPQGLKEIIKTNPYSRKAKHGGKKKIDGLLEDASVKWELQGEMITAVSRVLEESPGIKSLVKEFGMPPMMFTDYFMEGRENDFMYRSGYKPSPWFNISGAYLNGAGFIQINPKYLRNQAFLDHLIRHELIHAFHAMAQKRNKAARERMQEVASGMVEDSIGVAKRAGMDKTRSLDLSQLDPDELARAQQQLTPEMERISRMFTKFGYSGNNTVASQNPGEFVAEVLAYATSPDFAMRSIVPPEAFEIVAEFFGITAQELRKLTSTASERFI